MLEQTRRATYALLVAGLDRKDFRVRTERIMNGKRFCGYGDAQIVIWDLKKAVACTDAMLAEGLSVHHILTASGKTLVSVKDDGKGTFEVTDYREEQRND